VAAALYRVVPHPYNASPIAAMALFGGYTLRPRWVSALLPLAAMLVSDILLQLISHNGFYGADQFYVYGSFMLINIIGMQMRRTGALNIGFMSIAGSLLFFFITNFATWLNQLGMYPHTIAGLTACFIAGLPFLTGTLMGDLFFNGIFYAIYVSVPGLKVNRTVAVKA